MVDHIARQYAPGAVCAKIIKNPGFVSPGVGKNHRDSQVLKQYQRIPYNLRLLVSGIKL